MNVFQYFSFFWFRILDKCLHSHSSEPNVFLATVIRNVRFGFQGKRNEGSCLSTSSLKLFLWTGNGSLLPLGQSGEALCLVSTWFLSVGGFLFYKRWALKKPAWESLPWAADTPWLHRENCLQEWSFHPLSLLCSRRWQGGELLKLCRRIALVALLFICVLPCKGNVTWAINIGYKYGETESEVSVIVYHWHVNNWTYVSHF